MRFAIGYAPDEIEKPIMVFLESNGSVLVQKRGKAAPRALPGPFDEVLDSYSTTCLIRTVGELEPEYLSSLLAADESWDMLPRPRISTPA
jgi:hypothetical protein